MKSTSAMLLIMLIAYPFFAGCSKNKHNETEIVNKVVYKLIEADNKSDIKNVLDSYTDSVEFYPLGRTFTKGINNVRANYETLFKENKLYIITEILETDICGTTALITGINRGTKKTIADSSSVNIDDKYIAFLVRDQKGKWKIDKLIWGLNH